MVLWVAFFLLLTRVSESTQFSTFILSASEYRNHKLTGGPITSTINYLTAGLDISLTCRRKCVQHSKCAAVNYCIATNGTSFCELLESNICTSANGTWNLQSVLGCMVWDLTNDVFACVLTTPQNCTTVLAICQPQGGSLCDTCTKTCRDHFLRYNNKPSTLSSTFYPKLWPGGISAPAIQAECNLDGTMYLFKREVILSTGQLNSSYNLNTSFEAISQIVKAGGYSKLKFLFFSKTPNLISTYATYLIQAFESDGMLSVTFDQQTPYDLLSLNGSLVKAPFLNHDTINPICGPFWLLPGGNFTCPGGEGIRFWGRIVNGSGTISANSGFRCPSIPNTNYIHTGYISLRS